MNPNPAFASLARAVGTWSVTGTHPELPGRTLPGTVTFEPIEGGAFLRMHSKMEDPEIPEGIALIGTDGDAATCMMLYADTRGVTRRYEVTLHPDGFSWSRDEPSFAQRFRVTLAPDHRTMEGEGTMKKNGGAWQPDLSLVYVRIP